MYIKVGLIKCVVGHCGKSENKLQGPGGDVSSSFATGEVSKDWNVTNVVLLLKTGLQGQTMLVSQTPKLLEED